jgi:putative membrane protein
MLDVLATHGEDFHWWFPIFPLLWTGLIVGAVYLIMRGRRHGRGDRAREILAERYASGELTVEEYRRRLAELG